MKIYVDTTTGEWGSISDLIVVETDDQDNMFLTQASSEQRKDWLDDIMDQPIYDAAYLTAMLPGE